MALLILLFFMWQIVGRCKFLDARGMQSSFQPLCLTFSITSSAIWLQLRLKATIINLRKKNIKNNQHIRKYICAGKYYTLCEISLWLAHKNTYVAIWIHLPHHRNAFLTTLPGFMIYIQVNRTFIAYVTYSCHNK